MDDKIITQYMLTSLLEYEKIKILTQSIKKPLNILEIGAGYGRTAIFSKQKNYISFWNNQ